MILGLFPSKSANQMVCFDLVFYVFFFKQVFRPISDQIGSCFWLYRPISNQIESYFKLFQTESGRIWKKNK